jgi:hypothetical protein
VQTAQNNYLELHRSEITTYISAFRVIQDYAAICTPIGIDALVQQELVRSHIDSTAGATMGNSATQVIKDLRQTTVTTAFASASKGLGIDTPLSTDEAILLYVVFGLDNTANKTILTGVHNQLQKLNKDLDAKIFDAQSPPNIVLPANKQKQLERELIIASYNSDSLTDAAKQAESQILNPPNPAKPGASGGVPAPAEAGQGDD